MIARKSLLIGLLFALLSGGMVRAQNTPPAHDFLLANLWMQRAVEYRANALAIYALARIRLDEALLDRSWTAAPGEQKGDFQNLPPAVVLDVDETLLDNSKYQVWLMRADQSFSTRTRNQFCAAQVSAAVPGAVDFTRYAESKGVKIFYVTNRGAETEKDTRENMAKLGFPLGGNVDTFLMQGEKPDWTGAKSTRRAVIAKDYRILLNIGDNLGDFDDRYRSSEADRVKAFEAGMPYWGRQWLMLANPTYGSFDTAPYGHDFKKSRDEQRKAKWDVLDAWAGPAQP
jgi:acid phosphatase